jgi:hypothetical protein
MFVVRQSRLKLFAASVASAAVALLLYRLSEGWLDVLTGGTAGKAYFASWIFGALAAFSLFQALFNSADRAVLTPEGLLARPISNTVIPWKEISHIFPLKTSKGRGVGICLAPGAGSASRMKSGSKLTAKSKTDKINAYFLSLSLTGTSAEEFIEEAAQFARVLPSPQTPPQVSPKMSPQMSPQTPPQSVEAWNPAGTNRSANRAVFGKRHT